MKIEKQIKILEDICPALKKHISKRDVRHDFFKHIQTEILAYLLGFFIADGSVDLKRKTLRIQLNEDDKELIELYRIYISPNARIFRLNGRLIIGRQGQIYLLRNFIGIDITSSDLITSLVEKGFGYRKTYSNLHLLKLSDNLMIHLLRGFFDGDGCITTSYVPSKNNRQERVRSYFMIDCKSEDFLLEIQKFLAKYNIKVFVRFLNRDLMYRICTGSKKEICKIFKLLYEDSNFYLKRKYNKFNRYVNTEVTLLITEYRNALKVNVKESNNPSKSVEHPILDENVR